MFKSTNPSDTRQFLLDYLKEYGTIEQAVKFINTNRLTRKRIQIKSISTNGSTAILQEGRTPSKFHVIRIGDDWEVRSYSASNS